MVDFLSGPVETNLDNDRGAPINQKNVLRDSMHRDTKKYFHKFENSIGTVYIIPAHG